MSSHRTAAASGAKSEVIELADDEILRPPAAKTRLIFKTSRNTKKLGRLQEEIDATRAAMSTNLAEQFHVNERVEETVKRSEMLEDSAAGVFRKCHKVKKTAWYKNLKIIAATIVVVVVTVIVVVGVIAIIVIVA